MLEHTMSKMIMILKLTMKVTIMMIRAIEQKDQEFETWLKYKDMAYH